MANPFFNWGASLARFVRATVVRAEAVNGAFDLVSTGFDGVDAKLNRAMLLPADSATKEIFAVPGVRALKGLAFDASGNLTLTVNNTDSTAADAATASAAALAASNSASAASASQGISSTNAGTAVTAAAAAVAARDLAQQWATQITPEVVSGQGFGARKYALDAAASAALAAQTFNGTSTTSLTLSTGSKTFTTQTGKAWTAGQYIVLAVTASPTSNYMTGRINAYDPSTGSMTVAFDTFVGTGTYAAWSIGLAAPAAASGQLSLIHVTGVTNTAVAGTHVSMENAASSTNTLPATPADGDTVVTSFSNGLLTNVIGCNGSLLMGLTEDMVLNRKCPTIGLRFITGKGWWIL